MKKIDQPQRKEYTAIKLYIDDIRTICSFFEESNVEYKIQTSTHEFSSYDDLHTNLPSISFDKKIKNLEITSIDPHINLEFSSFANKVYIGNNDTTSMGLLLKIDTHLKSTSRFPSFLYSLILYVFIIFICFLISSINENYSIFLVVAWIVSLLWCIYLNFLRTKKSATIFLYERHRSNTFFKRKKDDIFLAIISAISAITGAVLFSLLQ